MATNNQELSSEDLAQVLRELFTVVQGKWYNIGLCLGLSPAILGNIQSNHRTSAVCLRVMLNKSINQGGLTWKNIVEALEDVTVNRKVLARKIRAKYCTPVATQTVLTTTRVAPGHPALIPQQGVFNNNAPVIYKPPVLRTYPVNPTAGPSNSSNTAVPTPVPPKKTTTTNLPGVGKRPPDRPIAGPSKVSLLCTIMSRVRVCVRTPTICFAAPEENESRVLQ